MNGAVKNIWHVWSSCRNPMIIETAKDRISEIVKNFYPTFVITWMPFFGQLENADVIIYILTDPHENTEMIENYYFPTPVYFLEMNKLGDNCIAAIEINKLLTKSEVRKICRSLPSVSPIPVSHGFVGALQNHIMQIQCENLFLKEACQQLFELQSVLCEKEKQYKRQIATLTNEYERTKALSFCNQKCFENEIIALTNINYELCQILYNYPILMFNSFPMTFY